MIDSETELNHSGYNQNVTLDILPKVELGYKTFPSIEELKLMKRNDLKKMKGFSVQKDQVRIIFENEIDLINANLKEFIKINGKNFEIDLTLENDKNN